MSTLWLYSCLFYSIRRSLSTLSFWMFFLIFMRVSSTTLVILLSSFLYVLICLMPWRLRLLFLRRYFSLSDQTCPMASSLPIAPFAGIFLLPSISLCCVISEKRDWSWFVLTDGCVNCVDGIWYPWIGFALRLSCFGDCDLEPADAIDKELWRSCGEGELMPGRPASFLALCISCIDRRLP